MRPMTTGGEYMKLLRIKDKKCEYSIDGISFGLITDMSKNDILLILEKIYNSEETCEVDDLGETEVSNEVQKIMYKNFSEHIKTFIESKNSLKEQIKKEFEEAEAKYKFKDN